MKITDIKLGQSIIAILIGGSMVIGSVTGFGQYKGRMVIDIKLADGTGRFVYLHQIIG